MLVVKNTFGVSSIFNAPLANLKTLNPLGGSSLNRKKYPKKKVSEVEKDLKTPMNEELRIKKPKQKLKSLSNRSKSKIRQKLIAFAQLHKRLSFVTLTFVNEVKDELAIKVLHKFLDNAKKRSRDFQYLWVAERQTKNTVFIDNIHFHLITNKFWKIEKWWQYWVDLQNKFGITPRDKSFKPSSAFDVKQVTSNNIKGVTSYLTKYVTKNKGKFNCQVWNCSKKISRLYTSHTTGIEFIRSLERMEAADQLGGKLNFISHDYCNICVIPLNRNTIPLYRPIEEANKKVWNDESIEPLKETKDENSI